MKILSLFLIVVGVAWALFNAWLNAGMEQIADWEYRASIFGWLVVISPWLLAAGAISALAGWHPKVGVLLIVLACAVLTGQVIYAVSGLFELEFSKWKPLYAVFGVASLITLFADAAAFRVTQL